MPGIEDVTITIPLGQEVVPLRDGNKYLGFIFARERTPQTVEAAVQVLVTRGLGRADIHADPFYTEAEKAARNTTC